MSKKILLIISFLICTYHTGFANKLDSFQIGTNMAGMKDSIDMYLLKSEVLVDSNPLLSSSIARKAMELSTIMKFYERHAYASRILGEAKLNVKEYYEAEKHLSNSLQFYNNTNQTLIKADILSLLGLTQYYLNKYSDALESYSEASNFYNKINAKQKEANTLQNIGLVYHNLQDLQKAEEYYSKSLLINKELNIEEKIAELTQNLGIICYERDDDSLALDYFNNSILYFIGLHDINSIGISYSNIGLIYQKNKDYLNANRNFEKANNYFSKTNYHTGQMWASNNIGACHAQLLNFDKAESFFQKSLEIAKKQGMQEGVLTNYKDLARLYEQTGNLKKSLRFQKQYATLKDSLTSAKFNQRIAELEALYKLESKEREFAQSANDGRGHLTRLYALLSIILIIVLASIIVFTSIAQKRKAEKRLNELKINLQSIVESRTKELNLQINERRTAEESDKLKSAFLANMSHELRTPMNAIIAFSNFLREPDILEEQRSEFLDHITSAGDTLLSLIDDIIDIAKIEAQQLKLFIQPTNITHLTNELHAVFEKIQLKNNKDHIQFRLNTDNNYNYIINTDSKRLKQVLSNLLENAFKYTEKGSIEIGFETSDNSVLFYVSDTGPGIPKDKHEVIFDRFSQLIQVNDRRTTHGTGLGLTICKNLIELLGGEICVDSDEGKGSTFVIRIPVESIKKQVNTNIKPKRKSKKSLSEKYNWGNLTILVAEDEDLNYKVLDTCLTRTKANIIRARDGASAVEICRNQKIDIVLMDIQMPGMDGYEATQEIKRINNRTPVIAQTSFAMIGEKERCLQAGCDDFVTKPLNINYLLRKIEDHIL
jgi:signal transduction histidine kinase/CheY-like chemotaxis protein